MPPKLKPEDFVEALLDSRVVEALTKAFTPLTQSLEESLTKKLDSIAATLRSVKEENSRLSDKCKTLDAENKDLKKQVEITGRRIDELERFSRCDNIVIRGLPEQSSAERASGATSIDAATQEGSKSVENTVLTFIRKTLHVEVNPADISTAHRLKSGPKDTTRPVLVRFTSRRVRNEVYNERKSLKGTTSSVYISEHLTKLDSDLFYEARKLLRDKKIFGAWTQHGLVHVRFSPDPAIRPEIVRCRADLNLKP